MNKVTNIFKEENCTIKEFFANGFRYADTKRIKIKFINENEILLFADMTGKPIPSALEVTFKLDKKATGNLTLSVHQLKSGGLTCMDVSTKTNQTGNDVRLYMRDFSINIPLVNDNKVVFKFTDYSNYARCGYVKIKCV